MPDEKTVYGTDDGTNVMFSAFVSHKAEDMTEGIGYCAKYTQTSPAGCEAKDWTAHIEWIAMPEATAAQVEEAIDSTVFSDLFDVAECGAYGTCPGGFKSVNTGGYGCECLKVKPGMEGLAAAFEKRRYAGAASCVRFCKSAGIFVLLC